MAKGLGKGIHALFTNLEAEKGETVQDIDIQQLRPNPYQPRKTFNEQALEELKQSIVEHGIVQPLIVRQTIKGYEIVVGERRFRAAQLAGMKTVPAVVRELSDEQMMEIALLENLQREDLNPIEEATAYQLLITRCKLTQEELAKRLGKSRPHIANHLRLLSLPSDVQQMIEEGTLSMGHGRALLALKNKQKLSTVIQRVIRESLNVRQLEALIQQLNENVPRETLGKNEEKSVFLAQSEALLRERLGTAVSIKKNRKKGKIEIEFFSEEDLTRILQLLNAYDEYMDE
ncbi:chromosome partitioning protein, ParB family [Anoxybacillus pushchinoensis]|uniref:Chromosome partitioning protein, ParB family n=1 Tax=Anoxybacillus pushchinoensis TaxID=150248 RepID=A0A1I0TDD3_9BACL|nr:ParB/RepB/Spo0J family partition protein [Anoxybacillus pushchinoensis]SFA49798.1 chromosome partitioning protein, ParB family [Anoxybacillus pushchinoensis]